MVTPATAPRAFLNSYSTYTYDPMGRMDILSARGYALLCNGLDPNTKIDPDQGQTDLLMRAPSGEVYPAVTAAPSSTGKIFGNGYKWRIRYSNSQTGETSGMSVLPTVGYSLGVVTSGTSFMGQTAYFKIAGVATTTGIDTIELLRNTSEGVVWFLVDKASNPGAASYVSFTDNTPDEDLWNNEQADLRVNPTYFEPHPPPCHRIFQHASGRVWFYGISLMGAQTTGQAAVTALSNTIAGTSAQWIRGREGQKFRMSVDPDRTIYRIIEVTDPNAFVVTPTPPANVVAGAYEILDDRDTRNIYMSQPLSPCQHDPLDVLTIGQDRSDGVKGVFSLANKTFVLTRRVLYGLEGDMTDDPALSVRVMKIADVGCSGFWAWKEIPNIGVVFVSEKKGVMLFDGVGVVPLGSPTPWHDFKPKTQFQDMDEGLLNDAEVSWDPDNKEIVVSYCPVGCMAQIEQIAFDPTTGAWRGPWRRPVFKSGTLRAPSGEDAFYITDPTGTLFLEGESVADGVASTTTGTILTVDNPITITASAAIFTNAMVGASIVFNDLAGNYYTNWIARRISTTKVVLMLHPPTALLATWTFIVGGIHWRARTGFLDLGEPMQPKMLHHLGFRWEPMVTSVDALVVDVTSNGVDVTESADTASATVTTETVGLIKGDANVPAGGSAFQVRLSGRASNGGPKVTSVIAHMEVSPGTADEKAGDAKKSVLTPTASA